MESPVLIRSSSSSLPDHSQLLSTIGGPCAAGCLFLPQSHCGETGPGVRTLCVCGAGKWVVVSFFTRSGTSRYCCTTADPFPQEV